MIPLFNINNHIIDTSGFDHALHGSVVTEFEEEFARYVGAKYACSVSSATNAIFLSLLNKHQEVCVPSMIPPVVLNSIINSGNTIAFRDDVDWVGGSYILHDFGDYKIVDSAQKVEREQFTKEANENDLMIFSFYPTKPVGSLDGGMVVSNDLTKIKWFKAAVMNGMSVEVNSWDRGIKFPGWKMYMNSFQATIALRNLQMLDEKKDALNKVRSRYNQAFEMNNSSEHLYRITVEDRDALMDYLKTAGISSGIHYAATHTHPVYRRDVPLPETNYFEKRTLSIPYHELLTDTDINKIIKIVLKFI